MYLVTGGAGFIGLNLVIALQARKAQGVAVCDRIDHADKAAAMAERKPAALFEPERLGEFLAQRGREITAVFHLGAISSTTETDWERLRKDNIEATLAMFRWCAEAKVPLIYASSAATYGDGSQGFGDDNAIAAFERLAPLNLYGRSKHETDLAILQMVRDGHKAPPKWAGLKFFNVYGPHERHKGEQRSIISKFYGEITATGRASLFRSHNPDFSDGGQLRDFIWVGDCVDAMLWLLDHGATAGIFNLGTGTARSFLDVATGVFAALDRPPAINFIDMPAELRGRYQYYTQAEMGRLRGAGYSKPFTAVEAGVQRYVQDYLLKHVS